MNEIDVPFGDQNPNRISFFPWRSLNCPTHHKIGLISLCKGYENKDDVKDYCDQFNVARKFFCDSFEFGHDSDDLGNTFVILLIPQIRDRILLIRARFFL